MKPFALLAVILSHFIAFAAVPQTLNYQGRVRSGAADFTGSGQFKFALVNADGTQTFWSNDNSSAAGSEPTTAVLVPVTKGLFTARLGDTAIPNMRTLPLGVFAQSDLRLRVWFNDGTKGFQRLTPDQPLA